MLAAPYIHASTRPTRLNQAYIFLGSYTGRQLPIAKKLPTAIRAGAPVDAVLNQSTRLPTDIRHHPCRILTRNCYVIWQNTEKPLRLQMWPRKNARALSDRNSRWSIGKVGISKNVKVSADTIGEIHGNLPSLAVAAVLVSFQHARRDAPRSGNVGDIVVYLCEGY